MQKPSPMRKRPDYWYIQSAALPYRVRDGVLMVLLVRSRKDKRWVLPKGIVEPSLDAATSAAKEAWEEAGVTGSVDDSPLGDYSYDKWGGRCRVTVYPLPVDQVHDCWPESYRRRQWLPLEEAAGMLRETRLRRLVRALPQRLEAG